MDGTVLCCVLDDLSLFILLRLRTDRSHSLVTVDTIRNVLEEKKVGTLSLSFKAEDLYNALCCKLLNYITLDFLKCV